MKIKKCNVDAQLKCNIATSACDNSGDLNYSRDNCQSTGEALEKEKIDNIANFPTSDAQREKTACYSIFTGAAARCVSCCLNLSLQNALYNCFYPDELH
jgi:hypothetical protein